VTTIELVLAALGALNLLAVIALLARPARGGEAELRALAADLAAARELQRDGFARLETALGEAGRGLRQEVGDRIGQLGSDLRDAQADAARAQGERLDGFAEQMAAARAGSDQAAKALREEVQATLGRLGEALKADLGAAARAQGERLTELAGVVRQATESAAKAQEGLRGSVEQRLDAVRETIEQRLDAVRTENAEKLEAMRATVDEKLQGTLEQRLGASFNQVNENLQRVFQSVGEMQQLATGVGDLKRVLTNVKSRGTWGETTLGTLIEQSLTPDQFRMNVEVVPGAGARVEYAIRLPGDAADAPVWLPIDCKLPTEDYERLMQAAERADAPGVEQAGDALERRIRACAKDISEKYVQPPHTTDFAVMFLPTEGLFAEVVRRPGLVDSIQSGCRVIVAGPTTLMALLSSLRMGFRTLAIQKRSSEVWQVLGAVKTEFGKFGGVLEKVGKKLSEAQNVVEDASRRSRAVDRKLRGVEALPEADAAPLLAVAELVELDE